MWSPNNAVNSAVSLTPERRQRPLTLDDVYSPTSDDLVAVLAGMVEDSNRYFNTFHEHEANAAQQADQIQNLLQEQTDLQAQLDDARSLTQLQAVELQECRRLLRGAEQRSPKRNIRHSLISIHELNEQLQLAATKYERERSLREKVQADLKAVQIELAQYKREKQELLTKAAQHVHVEAQQNVAIKQAREQRYKGNLILSSQNPFAILNTGENTASMGPPEALTKEQGISRKPCAPQSDDSDLCEVVTPIRRLSVMPLQPVVSDSSVPGASSSQQPVGLSEDYHVSPLRHPSGLRHRSQDAESNTLECGSPVCATHPCRDDVTAMLGSSEKLLIPLRVGEIIGSTSLTQHLSTEDAPQQEPSSVMCSQVFQGKAAVMLQSAASQCAAVTEDFSNVIMVLSSASSPEILTSHPIEAFAGNEPSEHILEAEVSERAQDQSGAATHEADVVVKIPPHAGSEKGDAVQVAAMATRSTSHAGHVAPTWKLRQDSLLDADVPCDGVPGQTLPPHASLERQVSSVSLADSDMGLPVAAAQQIKVSSDAGDFSASISRASSCSHDENLHRPAAPNAAEGLPPLSVHCPNRTPLKQKLANTGKASAKAPPYTANIDRARARDPHAKLLDTPAKTMHGNHATGPKQEWRLGGSSLRVRPDSGRPKSALVMHASSTLGPPGTPRRIQVISPHQARTPDMSRLLGTPNRQKPSYHSQRKLAVRSSLDDLPISRPFSQGGSARRATLAPGTVLPSYLKSDLKPGSQVSHQEKQRWL